MDNKPGFFDFAAEVGLTKHIGGRQATGELVRLCHVDAGKTLLDVGCGVGVTPCHIAKQYGCRVAGVDISPRMVERSRERVKRENLAERVEIRVADAQDLPFDNAVFDAVITESVTAFPEDKQKAVSEYARVTRPGGYVGLNECIWLKVPPPPEVVAWAEQDLGANLKPLTPAAWTALLEAARLSEIVVKTFGVNTREEEKGILQRYGWGGLLGAMGRMLLLYARSPAYRGFVKQLREGGILPANYAEYFGYGLFVGKK